MSNLNANAFPIEYEEYNSVGLLCKRNELGVTKLEYFTLKAMQGLVVNTGRNGFNTPESIAKESIKIAKETLKQLENE